MLRFSPWLRGPRSQVHVWDADGTLQSLVVETTTGLQGNNLVVKPNQLVAGAAYRFTLGVTSSGGAGSSQGSSSYQHPTAMRIFIARGCSRLPVKWCW